MSSLGRLILPPDVVIVPVGELPAELRAAIDHVDGDCSISRPGSRAGSSVVDASTVTLLDRFRRPSTIVDAVIAHSAAAGLDPRETLDAAFAVLGELVNDGLLVPTDSALARPIEAPLVTGQTFAGLEVLGEVQVTVDTAVHLARAADGQLAALKVARDGFEQEVRSELAHEAAILASLDGRVTPRVLGHGEADGRPYVAMTWCAGVDLHEAAEEARRLGGGAGRAALLGLAERVLAAYTHLHAQGVLHGDVHPRNLLVGGDGTVWIVDFGLAGRPSAPGSLAAGGRGGVDLYLEPEVAAARLAGRRPPAVSSAGEQYAVAAVVYGLLTGAHTHSFGLEQDDMLRQLRDDPPLAFVHHGVDDLAAVERVVGRALAKAPTDRHPSVERLRADFTAAVASDSRTAGAVGPSGRRPGPAGELLDDVLGRLAIPAGRLSRSGLAGPTASVQNGAAGLAYAVLRVAGIRGDAELLGQADVWAQRALAAAATPAGFLSDDGTIRPDVVGDRSLYHAAPGVHAVAGLVAAARCDEASGQAALDAFVDAVDRRSTAAAELGRLPAALDIAFGRAGLLVGCALLVEAASPLGLNDSRLRRLGGALSRSVEAEIARQPELAACTEPQPLGAAHGWAGVLFALLRWSQVTGRRPVADVVERLTQLAGLGRPVGRGMRWPYAVGESPLENTLPAGWCNGAAGFVALWTLAHRLTGDRSFEGLAVAAAWTAWDGGDQVGNLCCGLAGRAYALLSVHRHGSGRAWLVRARRLADLAAVRAREDDYRPDSLYNGHVGVAVLAAELEAPGQACMPLYEGETTT